MTHTVMHRGCVWCSLCVLDKVVFFLFDFQRCVCVCACTGAWSLVHYVNFLTVFLIRPVMADSRKAERYIDPSIIIPQLPQDQCVCMYSTLCVCLCVCEHGCITK